ncbi:MAG: tetratricopeptide repeat protein [Bacteroidetes bacterium]|nr:tetratricopeptide repeat protein [Bacteroidota bacterium]
MNPPLINNFLNKTRWQLIFLAGVISVLYFRSLPYEFIGLDEQSLLINKKEFNQKLSNIPKAFSQHVFQTEDYVETPGSIKFYRPLLTVSFILDAQFAKEGFKVFHFTNILFHFMAVAGLLFLLLQLKIPPPLSFVFSLLFAVHPLLTQAVGWIPGRNDSIACGFVLWSFYFLLKTTSLKSSPEERISNTLFHILFFTAALFTKENTVMFSLLCVFWILFPGRKNLSVRNKTAHFVSYILIISLWYFARKTAIGENISLPDLSGEGWGGALYYSFLKNFPLVLQYFQKTILPVNLAVMASVQDTNYGWVMLSLALFGAGIYFTKKIPWTEILFGLLWFFLFLLPTLLFSYFEGMEHRSYLPVIGLLLAFVHLEPVQNLIRNKNLLIGIFGTVILIFSVITFTRLPVFSSELNYWKNAYETSAHSSVVCRDYGVILTKLGDYPNAEKAYLEGIKRNPKETLLHYNLGVMYFRMQRFEEAKAQLAKELEINSTNFMVYHVLGVIYKQENRMEEAGMMWEQAVSINPNFVESYKELLSYYSQKKDTINFIRCKNALEKNGYNIIDKRNEK